MTKTSGPARPFNSHTFFHRHPALAWRACMALCRLSAHLVAPDWRTLTMGYQWKWVGAAEAQVRELVPTGQTRRAPMPFEGAGSFMRPGGKSACQFCGWPIFYKGDWRRTDLPKHSQTSRHACCTEVYLLLIGRVSGKAICRRQDDRCPETGEALGSAYELDHRVPLWRVRHDWQQHPWPECLRFWMPGNLQALSPRGHRAKTKRETLERSQIKRGARVQHTDRPAAQSLPLPARGSSVVVQSPE